ncbi:hypothetical protein WMY93_007455 [Mugilogobius chulae]|uniref:AIG1-type G domain-containing protein n=1 Tax=Mugilogobius chulae TaxID=88201 RepID=A0AAW0PNQ0_9GOBI
MYSLGKESTRQNRTVMVMGATGAGKSTLINGVVNYIAGVERKDDFRLKLVHEDPSKSQAESQTSEVSVYKLNYQEGFRVPYSLTLVDTPGFGDTRGIQRDEEITEQVRKLFTSSKGISHIDAICFVTQASLARLTHTQKYVFDSVLSIFGKDVMENILMLVTFADGKQPPFNNSALFSDNRHTESEDTDHDFDEMFWRMGVKSMQKFLTDLNKMETKSLQMTKEVLRERKQLQAAVEGLQPQVKAGLAKVQEIKSTMEKVKDHETDMTCNENHEIEVEVIKPVKVPLTNRGEYLTNCQVCHVTCHYPCGIKEDGEKSGCVAMDGAGTCTVCPGSATGASTSTSRTGENNRTSTSRTGESNRTSTSRTGENNRTSTSRTGENNRTSTSRTGENNCTSTSRTGENNCTSTSRTGGVRSGEGETDAREMKEKYARAKEEKLTVQQLIQRQEEEIESLQEVIVSLIDQSAHSLSRLILLADFGLSSAAFVLPVCPQQASVESDEAVGHAQAEYTDVSSRGRNGRREPSVDRGRTTSQTRPSRTRPETYQSSRERSRET